MMIPISCFSDTFVDYFELKRLKDRKQIEEFTICFHGPNDCLSLIKERAQDSGVLKVLLEAFKYLSPEDIDPEEYDIQDNLLRLREKFPDVKNFGILDDETLWDSIPLFDSQVSALSYSYSQYGCIDYLYSTEDCNISLNSTRPTNSYGGFLNLDPTKQRDVELKLLENPKATKIYERLVTGKTYFESLLSVSWPEWCFPKETENSVQVNAILPESSQFQITDLRKDANLYAFDINKKYKNFNIMKLDFDKLEELSENCKIVEQVEKDKDSNIYDEEVSQIIRPSKPNKAKQLDLRKALEKANFHLSSPEIDDDMFVNNSDDNSSVDDNVQEDCLSGDNIKDQDVELIDYSVINKSKSSSPICSLEKVGSGQLVIDTFIEEIMEMAIHEVKHILDTEAATVTESITDGILNAIWMRDTQLTIADEAIVENEIIEDDSEIIFKSEALQISENIVYDIFESFKVRESPCSHDFCIGKKTSIKEDEIRIQDNSSFTFEENHIANECEQSEKITKNELLSRTNAECTNNSQENISNDNQTETKYISESNSQQDLSAGVKENEESTEITSEKESEDLYNYNDLKSEQKPNNNTQHQEINSDQNNPLSEVLVDVNKHVSLTVDDEGLDSSDKKKLSPDVIEMKKNENKMKLEHWISKNGKKRRGISQSLSTPNLPSFSFSEYNNPQSPCKKVKYDLEINDAERNIQVPRCTDITKENEKLDEVKAVSNEDEVHDDKILENNHSNTSESHEDQTEPLNLTTRKTPGDEVSFKNKEPESVFMKPKSKREESTTEYESKETSDGTVFQIVHFTSPPKKSPIKQTSESDEGLNLNSYEVVCEKPFLEIWPCLNRRPETTFRFYKVEEKPKESSKTRDKLLAKILKFGPITQQSTDNKAAPTKMNDAAAKTNEAHESKQKDENKKIEEKKIENEIVAKNIVEIGSYIKRDEKETFMNMNNNEIKPNDTDDPTTLAKELRNENEIEMDETDDVKILATEKYINKGDKHNSITETEVVLVQNECQVQNRIFDIDQMKSDYEELAKDYDEEAAKGLRQWLLVDQSCMDNNHLAAQFYKLEGEHDYHLLYRKFIDYETEIVYPDIIYGCHVGIFILRKGNENLPVRHEDMDCKTLYAQNYFIFEKLWFVVLFDNKEEESERYNQALEIERISKGANTTCMVDSVLVSMKNLSSCLLNIFECEEVSPSVPVDVFLSSHEYLLANLCPFLNPVQVAKIDMENQLHKMILASPTQLLEKLQDFVSVGAIQLLAASLNVEFTFDVVNKNRLEEDKKNVVVERSDKLHSTNECIDVDAFAANSTEQSSQASINNEDDNVKIIDEEHNSSQPEKEEECDSAMKAYETQDHYVPVQQPSYMVQPTQITGYYEQPNYHPHFVQPQMVNCPPPLLRSAPITAFCEQSYMIEQPQPSQITAYGYPQYPQNMATIQMDAYGKQSFVSNMMAPHMLAYNGNSMASFGDHTLPQYIVPQHAPPQFVNQPMPSFYDQQQESHSHQYENTANDFDLNDSVSSLSTIYPRSAVASSASSSSDVSLSSGETDTSEWMDNGHKKKNDDDNFYVNNEGDGLKKEKNKRKTNNEIRGKQNTSRPKYSISAWLSKDNESHGVGRKSKLPQSDVPHKSWGAKSGRPQEKRRFATPFKSRK